MNDSWYILMMMNDCIWYEWIFIIKNQSFETLIRILKSLIKWIKCESEWKIKQFRMNNIKKFHKLARWAEKKRMITEFITSYISEQNNVIEWVNKILLIIVRTLLFDSDLSKSFWSYAAHSVIYIKNHVIKIRNHSEKILHEL